MSAWVWRAVGSLPVGSGVLTAWRWTVVSSRGGKYGFVYKSRQKVYRKLRSKGFSKSKAARISNAGRGHNARVRMAKKAARTRKARGK